MIVQAKEYGRYAPDDTMNTVALYHFHRLKVLPRVFFSLPCLKKAAASQPKNVLLFMGDGMGFEQIEMTWLLGGARGKAVSPCFQVLPRPPGSAGIGLYLGRK
jgi:alkaline phosphatase